MNRWAKRILAMMLAASLAAGIVLPGAGGMQVKAEEADLTDGLIGYWTFEGETEADRFASKASIADIVAVRTGSGVTLDSTGGIGGDTAVSFNGNNDSYLTLNLVNAGQGLASSSAFTIGAWIKYEAIASGNTSVFHQEGDGNGNGRAILTIGGENKKYGTYLDAANRYCSKAVKQGEWHHVMMAVDNAGTSPRKVYFYLNGVQVNTETLTGDFVNGSGNIRVGAHRMNTENTAVNGTMDEIRYYNKVISADTAKAIYDLHSETIGEENPKEPITIEVDTKDVIREIPSAMFGINHRYHNYGYGSWDKENDKINDDFNALAKEAKFGSVRYPGGTVSNLFTWKDSIGPKEERTTIIAGNNFYSGVGETPVDPAFGVDEAMSWIYDDLNAEAIFVYGLGRGNPQDAADLVEYLNAPNDESNPGGGIDWAAVRAANGHEEPYGVVRFELGNEFSDTGQNYWMSGISENSKGYTDLYIEGDRMTISGQTSYYQTNNKVAKKGDWRASASLSGGEPNEERYVYYLPVVEDTAEVYVAGTKWKIVDSLVGQGAANVCTFDYETGKITFGDDTDGNIPALGAEITCNYQTDQSGFVGYYDAMKKVADEIGINIEIYSGIYDGRQNEFIDKMHEKGYDTKYDGVIIHPYSNGVTGYEDSLVKAKNFSNSIAAYKNKMKTVTNDDNKKVAVSEFGILSVSPASNYQTSLGHAIYIANHMIDCVNSGAAYQNKHCLVDTTSGSDNLGAWQQCVIQCHEGSDGNRFVSTPSARLFSIFNQMTGNEQVRETITGNDIFTGSGANAVNTINVYSTKDHYGNTYVLVVNNEDESNTAVDISIKDRDLTNQRIQVWSMTSEYVTDMNTLDAPDKVTVKKTQEIAAGDNFAYMLEPHSICSFKIQAEAAASGTIIESGNQTEGTVSGIPDEVIPGEEIIVLATPAAGYEFAGWFVGDSETPVSTDASYTFTAGCYESALKAKFIPKKYRVAITAKEGGSVKSDHPENADYNTLVTVTAEPQEGYVFDGWYEGNIQVSKEAGYTFLLKKDTNLTAMFIKKQVIESPVVPVRPKEPKGVKAKKTKKGIQISWKKAVGADGYVIYRSYKQKKGFKKIKTISGVGTKKYVDKKASVGKTAYYKIKSYKNINGKKVLSSKFSKVVKKKR